MRYVLFIRLLCATAFNIHTARRSQCLECRWLIKGRKWVIDCELSFRTQSQLFHEKNIRHGFFSLYLLLFKIVLGLENDRYYYYFCCCCCWQCSNHQFVDFEQIVTHFRPINELNIDSNAVCGVNWRNHERKTFRSLMRQFRFCKHIEATFLATEYIHNS